MERIWSIKEKASKENAELEKKYHPLILELLANRGILEERDIENFFGSDYKTGIHDPFIFSDMEKAVERITLAKKNKEKIAIFGDYDADGVTATALLFEVLRKLGFSQVEIYIPDRQLEGYGMNPEAIKYLKGQEVELIITVDCGITNIAEVKIAAENGNRRHNHRSSSRANRFARGAGDH